MKSPMKLWNVGVFKENPLFNIEASSLSNCIKVFSSKKVRFKKKHIYTIADPFLFTEANSLFLFAEINKFFDRGYIVCWQTQDLKKWKFRGTVLRKDFHISYPSVFRDNNIIYMLPETAEANEVALWKFENFPDSLSKSKVLLTGKWYDPSIFFYEGQYFLFVTSDKYELHIFNSPVLQTDNWRPHPSNPITGNKKFSRNGGGVIKINDSLYRIAQNCEEEYGAGIVIRKIITLNENVYEEIHCNDDWKPVPNYSWQALGRHHMSMTDFQGEKIIAIDGKGYDLYVNQLYSKANSLVYRLQKLLNKQTLQGN